jgi:DNA-binding MarR family transcriptional regulator
MSPGLTVTVLRARLGIVKQSLARTLDQLEGQGLLRRTRGERDARERRLFLTDAGRAAEDAISGAIRDRLAHAFRLHGPDVVMGTRRLLASVSGETAR